MPSFRTSCLFRRSYYGLLLLSWSVAAAPSGGFAGSPDNPKSVDARLEHVDGAPTLFIDGKATSPLLYYQGHWGSSDGALPVRLSTECRRFEIPIHIPASGIPGDGIHAALQISVGRQPGTVWIDDVSVVDRSEPGVNLISNGDFSGADWRKTCSLFLNKGEMPARADARIVEDELRVDVTSGGNRLWHVHLITNRNVVLKRGRSYVFSARMHADGPRDAEILVVDRGADLPHYDWREKLARSLGTVDLAAEAGVHLHSFTGPHGLRLPWPKDGQMPDFGGFDFAIDRVLAHDPSGLLIPRIDMEPPCWWKEKHPDDVMLWSTADGMTTEVVRWPEAWKERREVSVASEAWRKEASEHLRALVTHLEDKYGDHIIGYHVCGQNSAEWFYIESWLPRLNCCEPAFEEAWRRWLKVKYGTVERLRNAWGGSVASFEEVRIPSRAARLNASVGFFRDPVKERSVVDFHEYQNVAVVEAIDQFGKTVKEATGGRKLVVCFYGYHFELASMPRGLQQSGHLALGRLLDSPNVDVLSAPISYADRGPGGIGAFMAPVDSAALRGKLWVNEDDTRTFRTGAGGADYRRSLQVALMSYGQGAASAEQTAAMHERNFSHILTRGAGCWWMDLLGEGWLEDAPTWKHLGRLKQVYDPVVDSPTPYHPEIAVIVDERSCFYLSQNPSSLTRALLRDVRGELYRIGAPCGFYLLDDLVAGRIPDAKMVVFLNCFAITKTQREAIRRHCKGDVCVFFYANGFLGESADVRNMEELLGTPVQMSAKSTNARVQVTQTDALAEEVKDFGTGGTLSPVFVLDEERLGSAARIRVLGRYADGRPAVWVRRGGPYSSIYVGAPGIPARFFRNVAEEAGVHLYTESGDVVAAGNGFVAIHASSAGEKRLSLRDKCTPRDVLSGDVVGRLTDLLELSMRRGETRVFRIREEK